MSALRGLLLAAAFVAAGLTGSRADAFPSQRVHDRLWAKAQPWATIDLPGGTDPQWIWVYAGGVSASCTDPVSGRNEPLCATPDHGFNIHAFADGVGELQWPQQCVYTGCWMYWEVPAGVTRVALLVHGTHDTRGLVTGNLQLYALNIWQSSVPLSFSGDIMVDVSAPAHPFDVETVLVPDGPILDPLGGPTRPGNAANDFLGVDATEVWMMASDGMMLRADTQTQGVGFAGRLAWSSFESQPYSTALIRPWTPPPSGFTVVLNSATQIWDTPPVGPAAVTVGEGRMRAIFNDRDGYDQDGDGLSNAVESEVGTCNGLSRWGGQIACIHADTFNAHRNEAFMDPRDTDGDGISDFAEVIGSDVSQGRLPRADGACEDPAVAPVLQAGANLTLPLWGFNPLHKDALIEIDIGPRNGDAACPAIGAMDTTCNTAGGQTYALPPVGTASLNDYLEGLRGWHQIYAMLPAWRVNNPDGAAGIELHFDVTTTPVASTHHGTRLQFTMADYTGQARTGLLTFDSTGASGSSCSCRNQQNCVSARMGGFGRWTRHNDSGNGGGQAGFGGPVDGALRPAASPAHELGHHLGLAHGGPYSTIGNPFILSGAWDAEWNLKVVHVSLMTYTYTYVPGMGFSLGEYAPYPLPRLATDGSGLFGYQESLPTAGDVTTQPFNSYNGVGAGFPAGPTGCSGASCIHTDFNRNGVIGGVHTDGVSGTEVLYGHHQWIYQASYYCPMEQVRATLPNGNGRCCSTGTRNSAGVCPTGTRPDAQPSSRTMLLAGQSATVAANNRLYTFFLDDLTPDPLIVSTDRPESRYTCSLQGPSPSTSCAALTDAKLRWAAIDGFSVPAVADASAPFACASRDCVTPGTNQLGNLAVDGASTPPAGSVARFTGSTQLAATTLGSGSNQKVILAWATRRSTANGGLRCVDTTPWCANDWSPMEVRFGNASTIGTAGVQVLGSTGTALFGDASTSDGAPRGEHVSGVALAAWDPDANGAPTRAMLVARVVGAPGRNHGELYWTMCDVSGGCGQMQRLTTYADGAEGGVVRSFTAIAAAVDHPSSGAPSLALALGAQSALASFSDLQVLRMTPRPSAGAPFERRLNPVRASASVIRRSLLESSVGVAFTSAAHGNRMIFTAEGFGDQGWPVMYYWTATRAFVPGTDTYFRLDTQTVNVWDSSRAALGTELNSSGQILPLQAHAPGFVASLYQDARPNVTGGDARIAFLEGDVRAGVQHMGQSGPLFLLRPLIDSRLFAENYNYDEVASLAYWLCPTLQSGSRGTIGPDLIARGSPLDELRCQRGAAWGRNSGGIANLARLAHHFCSGPCPRSGSLPADYLSLITDYVTQPGMLAPPTVLPPPENIELDVLPARIGRLRVWRRRGRHPRRTGAAMKPRLRSLVMLMVMGCSNTFVGSEDVTSPDRIDGRGDPADTDAPVDAVDDRADTMSADGLDAVDEPLDGARDRMEAADDRPDATVPDRMDVMVDRADAAATDADALEVEAAVDATGEEIASPGDADCPRDPPAGPPPEVGRSCGAGRAPAEHCREVAFCGGPYRMGSTEAWDVTSVAAEGRNLQMRVCDLHDAVARGGYVDAYEVSVARYRAWVNAGFPHPRAGESFFNGLQWMSQFDRDLVIPNRATMDDRVPGVVSTDAMCTWSGTPGVNDDLPISCVPVMAAIAFCWWESKHLITEIGWEYLATNRGTTPTPFGAIPAADAVCSRGDVGGYTGQCPRTAMPTRIGTHPGGATRNPAGVHDLWGGMQEWVIGLASPYSQYFPAMPFCSRDAPRSVDGAFEVSGGSLARGEVMQRGPAWFQNATEFAYFYHSATRAGVAGVPIPKGRNPTSVRVGFRCARWLPEPR